MPCGISETEATRGKPSETLEIGMLHGAGSCLLDMRDPQGVLAPSCSVQLGPQDSDVGVNLVHAMTTHYPRPLVGAPNVSPLERSRPRPFEAWE